MDGGREEWDLVGVGYGREGLVSLHMGLLPRWAADFVGVGASCRGAEESLGQSPTVVSMGKVPKVLVGSEGMWMCSVDFLVLSR